MKKIFFTIALTLSAVACSLTENPDSFVNESNFYNNDDEALVVLNGCYRSIKPIYSVAFLHATEAVTDLAYSFSSGEDARLDISPAKPEVGKNVWMYGYRGIKDCNSAIAGIEGMANPNVNLLGEAKVMRAMYYHILTSFFGDVPFYTHPVTTVDQLNEVAHLPRMSAVATRDSLIADLLSILPEMEQVRTCEVDGNRARAAVGWMLVAKMAMWNEEWETAIDAIEALEAIYGEFNETRYPLQDIMWRYKNTPESIFEIQHKYEKGGIEYVGSCAPQMGPYSHTAGTKIFDGVEIPEMGENATAYQPLRPYNNFFNGIFHRDDLDRRLELTIVWEYNGKEFKMGGGNPWLGPRYWCPNMTARNDDNNYPVFRYADALLMKSECYYRLGDAVKCAKYLNMTRTRAGIAAIPSTTPLPDLFYQIRDERARELFGEFQRKFDLVRWGSWYEDMLEYCTYGTVLKNIRPCHEYYPIPDVEVGLSGGALDNDEYAKYNL